MKNKERPEKYDHNLRNMEPGRIIPRSCENGRPLSKRGDWGKREDEWKSWMRRLNSGRDRLKQTDEFGRYYSEGEIEWQGRLKAAYRSGGGRP